MLKLLVVLAILAIAIMPKIAHAAVANPDSMAITDLRAYSDLLEDNDMLFLYTYNITYVTPPTVGVDETFLANLATTSGTVLKTVLPTSFNTDGYGDGFVGFYFDAENVTSLGLIWGDPYVLSLEGNPTQFTSIPTIENSSITYRSTPSGRFWLTLDLRNLLTDLEDSWVVDLIDYSVEGHRATLIGQDYVSRVIPQIGLMAPDLMSSRQEPAIFEEREFTNAEADRLADFWVGTTFETSMQALADSLNVEKMVLSTILLLVLAGALTFYMVKITERTEFGLLTIAIVVPLGATIGLTDMKFAAVLGMIGILGIGYVFFYKSA